MRRVALILIGLLGSLLILTGGAPQNSTVVPQADIDEVNARYAKLGLTLPHGGVILPDPYSPPYSGRSFVVPRSWIDRFATENQSKQNPTLRASALREDLPILKFVMSKTYSGWQRAADRGWNWDAWFLKWEDQLSRDGDRNISLFSALSPWSDLENFQLDYHSHPMVPGFEGVSLSATLSRRPDEACSVLSTSDGNNFHIAADDAGQQPHAVDIWNGSAFSRGWYVSYPDRFGALSSIRCGKSVIALTMTAQPKLKIANPFYARLSGDVGYVRTPALFFYEANDSLRKALLQEGPHAPRAVILDLRSNGGGDAPNDILDHWFSQKSLTP
jgi:hypothetical protein